ncbi:hypothetical protein QE152_g7278 [Popillia japonica]|uniref:Uncharacterized protein n=1 Tax=Popillia japonica TaxID=7064 RepID=A0AAW1MGR7_POPJA
MSRNVMTITKWVPLEIEDNKSLYVECKQLKRSTKELNERIAIILYEYKFKNISKLYHTDCDESFVQNLQSIVEETDKIKDCYNKALGRLTMEKPHQLTESKAQFWKTMLWRTKLKFCYMLQQCVYDFVSLFIYYGEQILALTLR